MIDSLEFSVISSKEVLEYLSKAILSQNIAVRTVASLRRKVAAPRSILTEV